MSNQLGIILIVLGVIIAARLFLRWFWGTEDFNDARDDGDSLIEATERREEA